MGVINARNTVSIIILNSNHLIIPSQAVLSPHQRCHRERSLMYLHDNPNTEKKAFSI